MTTPQLLSVLHHRSDELAALCRRNGGPLRIPCQSGDLLLMTGEDLSLFQADAAENARITSAENARRDLLQAARQLHECLLCGR